MNVEVLGRIQTIRQLVMSGRIHTWIAVEGHEDTLAAKWLKVNEPHQRPGPVIPTMRKLFGLTAFQAIEAIRKANGGGE